MKTKTYQHKNVTYSYSIYAKKWEFKLENSGFTFLESAGGKENAHKIAGLVAGGFKRTQGHGLDQLARVSIDKIVGRI